VAKFKGVNYFNNGSNQVPDEGDLDLFYTIMDDADNYLVLIHCYYGTGRAEIDVALYRIEYEKFINEAAVKCC
jgi:protein-tyrosine phosphatase